MAIHQALGTSYIERKSYGNFPDNTGNWTIFAQIKYTNTPSTFGAALTLFKTTSDFANPYIWLGSSDNTLDIFVEAFNGTTTIDLDAVSVIVNTWHWIVITYNSTTHLLSLIVDGSIIDSKTINFSSITFDGLDLLSNAALNATANVSVAYCRAWSNILSASEMTAEAASMIAVKSTGLLWDCPLQASIDLTSHNNTLNQLVASGTVTTDTDDPLLDVVAGPPTNTTPATAVTIDYDSAYFQDVNSGGIAVAKTWFKIPATNEGIIIIGAMAFGDLITYKPSINIFEGLANANANITYQEFGFGGGSDLDSPFQVPIDSSKDYYYDAARNGAVAASTLQVSIIKSLSLPVPIGSIMVNDDSGGYIQALDVGTGYPIHFFTIPLNPTGEGGAPINDGTIVICKNDGNGTGIYDSQFNLVADPTGISIATNMVSSNLVDTFAVGTWPLQSEARLISKLGVVDPIIYDVGTGNLEALGLNVDASKFYFFGNTTDVKTWIIATNSAGANLLAADATLGDTKGPIIVLQDGRILVPFIVNATHHFIIKLVDNTGSLIHTYDLGIIHVTIDQRLATDPEDPTFFWGWGKEESPFSGFSFFNKVKVSDGSLIVDLRNIVQYESGLYNGEDGGTTTTPIRWGHSESCPFWINRVELFAANNAKSGLYILTGTGGDFGLPDNPILRHDVDWIDTSLGTSESVKIPDPYYDTYLAGDE